MSAKCQNRLHCRKERPTSFGDGTVEVICCNGRNCEPPAGGEHDLHVGLKAPVVVLIYVNAK
jgi:hypothetical protein